MFVDRIEIELHAGRGGDGCASFRREKYVPRGGPDGGDGGNGGSIIFRALPGVNSLAGLAGRKFYHAQKGQPGMGSLRHGRNGKDMTLDVPCGTSVIDAEDGYVIKDLTTPDESFTVARGGKGGRGNSRFKSSTNQSPRHRTLGTDGEMRRVILELKCIADVGLVGKPNAGKSTLLARISSARPEIADYPFTTKFPNLGIVDVDMERSFVLADIPGLIEGASEGVGLGHEFLKHVQRAGLLVHLVEPEPVDGTHPIENYRSIRDEIQQFDAELLERDELVVVTKNEMDPDGDCLNRLKEAIGQEESRVVQLMSISAVTGDGLPELLDVIMADVLQRRTAMAEAGTPAIPIRKTDAPAKTTKRRVPPHMAGPTAQLSDTRQAKHVSDVEPPTEDSVL